MSAPMMAANGTRFDGLLVNTEDNSFGPAADFDGDGKAESLRLWWFLRGESACYSFPSNSASLDYDSEWNSYWRLAS